MTATDHTFCRACDQLIPSGHLRRGGAIYVLGSWYCKQCCMDGTASGAFLTVKEESSSGAHLAPEEPAPTSPELEELRIRQELLLSEIERLQGEAHAAGGVADGAGSDQRARELEAELAADRGSAAALQDELARMRRDLARANEARTEAGEVHAERDLLAARVVELEQALEELRTRQSDEDEGEDPAAALALEEARSEAQRQGEQLEARERELLEAGEFHAERDLLAARVVELEQALEELRTRQSDEDEGEDLAAALALEEARSEAQRQGEQLEAATSALRDAQRSEAQLHTRVHELLQGGGTLPPPTTEPPARPGVSEPSSPSVRTSDMSQERSTPPSTRHSVRSIPSSGRVVRAIEYVGSTDFFRTPLTWVYFGLGVANLLFPLYIGYALIKGTALGRGLLDLPAKNAFVISLEWLALAIAGWISFELWRARLRHLPNAADEEDPFCATPLYAHLMRTTGEWLGIWIAVVGVLNGLLVEISVLTTLVDRPDAEILMRSLGLPGSGLAMIFAFPVFGYLIIFGTRTAAEALSALTAIANNTRRD